MKTITMSNSNMSQFVTIELGPTFGSTSSDIGRVRSSQVSWIDELDVTTKPIFTFEIPLELVGVAADETSVSSDSLRSSPSSLTFALAGDVTMRGITPDSAVRDVLFAGGSVNMSVDSLSRSVILTDVDERSFIDAVQTRTDIDTESLDTLKRDLLVPTFYDQFDDVAATKAQTLLTENIQRHERQHVDSLIDPTTALWREFELYWRSILVGANPRTWRRPDFLERLAALYSIPSYFVNELIAMLGEDYTADDPAIRQAVETSVASQRGVEGVLLQFIENHSIDTDLLLETLKSPIGEQYCDLWLAFVLDELRSGRSLDEIDATDFHRTCDVVATSYDDVVRNPETRAEFVDFICERCLGPVFELVRLKFVSGTFVLERTWVSLNPNVSDAENLLAVRRALYRRQFLSTFSAESGLDTILNAREGAVKQIIRGSSLSEVSLFDVSYPSPTQLAEDLQAAQETAAEVLLGPQATIEDLTAWLNDAEYDGSLR